jgi:hypothetical protein
MLITIEIEHGINRRPEGLGISDGFNRHHRYYLGLKPSRYHRLSQAIGLTCGAGD